ncbi:hypothetical protein PIB30_039409 [Stylosanthes scabra]|uniref:Uncharacterized protein n=1 Tax=Stylosanthes scabra TaxID=79078 RepID=A0ABU6QDV1_9FABA|nr:hypothetical protein [Stylosanthes scabra]
MPRRSLFKRSLKSLSMETLSKTFTTLCLFETKTEKTFNPFRTTQPPAATTTDHHPPPPFRTTHPHQPPPPSFSLSHSHTSHHHRQSQRATHTYRRSTASHLLAIAVAESQRCSCEVRCRRLQAHNPLSHCQWLPSFSPLLASVSTLSLSS